MEPLDELGKGVGRIKENVLTEEIVYSGDVEFEEICATFNEMQTHILEEQEKNRRYEKARTEMIAGLCIIGYICNSTFRDDGQCRRK